MQNPPEHSEYFKQLVYKTKRGVVGNSTHPAYFNLDDVYWLTTETGKVKMCMMAGKARLTFVFENDTSNAQLIQENYTSGEF